MTTSTPSDPQPISNQARLFTMIGMVLALLLAALDQTIVATAGPEIQKSLNIQPSLYTWLTISYLVSSTVVVSIYGKLGDIYGRKPVITFGVVLFLIGSLLCGLAWDAASLIGFRAVQGLGAGALLTTAFGIVADLYSPAERGRINGVLSGIIGLSSILGPLLGGWITDSFGWHWVFFVNIPLGLIALGFIFFRMPFIKPVAARGPIDFAGAFWLIVCVVPLLLALSLGSSNPRPGETALAWGSWQIIAMFATFVVGLIAFIITESRAKDPLLELSLFKNPTFAMGNLAAFVLQSAFFAAFVFLPLFMVNVVGLSATLSGLTTTPMTFGLIVSSIVTGILTTRYGRYKPIMLASLAIMFVGFLLMGFTLSTGSNQLEVSLKMVVIGLGLGAGGLYSLAVQNALPVEKTGVATASVNFFQQLGGTVGLAVMGTIFASSLTTSMQTNMGKAMSQLPPALQTQMAAPPAGGAGEGAPAAAPDYAAIKAKIEADSRAQEEQLIKALRDNDAPSAQALLSAPQTPAQLKPLLQAVVSQTAPAATREAALTPILEELSKSRTAAVQGVTGLEQATKQSFTEAISNIYRISSLIILAGFLITLFLPEIPLRKTTGIQHTAL
jgi:EmrB/QacA subfamily drug resistance transporter